jgi:4-amino-4-deoxy-L-arabinose transferase-like glycosyltransferase
MMGLFSMSRSQGESQAGFLGLPWLLGLGLVLTLVCDRLWFAVDSHIPSWDEADYLNGALAYWRLLGGAGDSPVSGDGGWRSFWQLAPKIPPLVSVLTVPFFRLFGPGIDAATGLITLLTVPLVWVIYDLGSRLFKPAVGLWGAGLCLVLPGLYGARLDYMLDYPVTVAVAVAFWGLTRWWWADQRRSQWIWAIAGGLLMGLALLTKQTSLIFLLGPAVWTLVVSLRRRRWGRLAQWLLAAWLAQQLLWPWWTTNWLLILTSNKRASLDSAIKEGDPSLLDWRAWTYYLEHLPHYLSWPLLVGAIAGILFWLSGAIQLYRKKRVRLILPRLRADRWLWWFGLSAYGLCSLSPNKDGRYFLAALPVLSLIVARGLLLLTGKLKGIRWGALGLAGLTMVVQLLPLPWPEVQRLANAFSPGGGHPAQLNRDWPQEAVIAEMIQQDPYLKSTLGVLPSTADLNQHNVSFVGGLQGFQVQGRQVGVRMGDLDADRRSLDWFLTKTGDQGSIPASQRAIVQAIEADSEFQIQRSWPLADGGQLNLHHRVQPRLEVLPLEALSEAIPLDRKPQGQPVQLSLTLPKRVTPNQPVPVTYEWSGTWSALHRGIVLLSWIPEGGVGLTPSMPGFGSLGAGSQSVDPPDVKPSGKAKAPIARATKTPVPPPAQRPARPLSLPADPSTPASALPGRLAPANPQLSEPGWIHDHGIALGFLKAPPPGAARSPLRVTERLAMLSGAPGRYHLEALYLDRLTQQTLALEIPVTELEVTAGAIDLPAPELDWLTQLRQWALLLPQGTTALAPAFESIARVNQYDPFQDYLNQAALSLTVRLKQKPWVLDWAYSLALAQVIRRDAGGAIGAFHHVAALDPSEIAQNYLAFVQLYDLNPREADRAIAQAGSIDPRNRETQQLSAISALFQGDILRLIRLGRLLQGR